MINDPGDQNCIYLEDQEVTVEGLRIYGSPWQPEFCDWAFNLPRGEVQSTERSSCRSHGRFATRCATDTGAGSVCMLTGDSREMETDTRGNRHLGDARYAAVGVLLLVLLLAGAITGL